jgi:hypothetical protein
MATNTQQAPISIQRMMFSAVHRSAERTICPSTGSDCVNRRIGLLNAVPPKPVRSYGLNPKSPIVHIGSDVSLSGNCREVPCLP